MLQSQKKNKNVVVIITTYERPELLKRCLKSLEESGTMVQYVFVDDDSKHPDIEQLLIRFTLKKYCIYKRQTTGVGESLKIGLEFAFGTLKADVAVILDSDTEVKRNWLQKLLELHEKFPLNIVSGFNTLTEDAKSNKPRHPIAHQFDGYAFKPSIGGVNMVFGRSVYDKFIAPHLLEKHWDWKVVRRMKEAGRFFIVTIPSVVQHTGIGTGMHKRNPDIAFDYE